MEISFSRVLVVPVEFADYKADDIAKGEADHGRGAENAKVGRWFSFGTLGNKFCWGGSPTTWTENSFQH